MRPVQVEMDWDTLDRIALIVLRDLYFMETESEESYPGIASALLKVHNHLCLPGEQLDETADAFVDTEVNNLVEELKSLLEATKEARDAYKERAEQLEHALNLKTYAEKP